MCLGCLVIAGIFFFFAFRKGSQCCSDHFDYKVIAQFTWWEATCLQTIAAGLRVIAITLTQMSEVCK